MNAQSKFTHSTFLQKTFEKHAKEAHFTDSLHALICDEYISICHDFDLALMQDSWSWRNTHLARELAKFLVDNKGELNKKSLYRAIQLLQENLFSLGPGRHHDASRQEHILKILKLFYEKSEFMQALKRICRPIGHQVSERMIKDTLFLPDGIVLTDGHARQAALSALLTSLRQNVGSCFATAPAILIQQEQPLNFLADIGKLFGTGRLSRTFEGVEYTVPLSVSWGVGDLYRPIILSSLGSNPLKMLSFSPGLQAAFESAGLIEKKASHEEKKRACEEILRTAGFDNAEEDPFLIVTPEQILKKVLLKTFSVSEKDVRDYKERSVQSPLAELVIHAPLTQGGKNLSCSRYLKAFDGACLAFKALTDNALLKSWEFTLASLSESKADSARWNLYASLGVRPEESNGIGESLYGAIQGKIQLINKEIEKYQSTYDHLFAQARYLEGRISRAASERELGWMQAEYQIRRHEINRALNERDEIYEKGKKLQGLYPFLINFYGEKIKDYFQEIYDAEMHDVESNPYDDSPAGFRLLYKHGRSNTALWTSINSGAEYIQHLTSFFVSTEIELNQFEEVKGLQKEISELITVAILTIKRPEFLESSLNRLAKAYSEPIMRNPLENLDKVKRKPWSYISGGTMSTLVSSYWGNPQKPQEEKRWVESEKELLAFLIDSMKELPLSIQKKYRESCNTSMLSFSPTHAYLCKPGWKQFRKAWENEIYTYTWIRDNWMVPQQKFLDSQMLDHRMMEAIIQQLLHFIPVGYRPILKHTLNDFTYSMTPYEFRENMMKKLSYEKWLKGGLDLVGEELDSILYHSLPFFPEHMLREQLEVILQEIDEINKIQKDEIFKIYDRVEENFEKYTILSAKDLRNIAEGLLIIDLNATRSSVCYHRKITEAMQKTGLGYPEPIVFADTNWVKNVFGFIVNPGTRDIELWRFDECASEGRPIPSWKIYLNGTVRQEWGLYKNPHQYGTF